MLENNLFAAKQLQSDWRRVQLTSAAWQLQTHFEELLPKRCFIQPKPAQFFRRQTLAVWRQASCTGNFQSFLYYYVIEPMGHSSCTQMANRQAEFYRITQFIRAANPAHNVQMTLQSTVAKAGEISPPCHGLRQEISPGRQTITPLL